MSNKINQHGLQRYIPADIRRSVRQRDGFGCVVCGNAIYDYEHLNPEFKDATAHTVEGIILLCDGCHRKKGNFLSVERILKCAANPAAKQAGFSREAFDIADKHPRIELGPLSAENVDTLIEIENVPIFSIHAPEEDGGPFRINARLYNESGEIILDIVENEWRTRSDNWDVEIVGNTITIRSSLGQIPLRIRSEPPHKLVIERLDFLFNNTRINFIEGSPIELSTNGQKRFIAESLSFFGCKKAIEVRSNGIGLGVGGGRVQIGRMVVNPTTERPFENFAFRATQKRAQEQRATTTLRWRLCSTSALTPPR